MKNKKLVLLKIWKKGKLVKTVGKPLIQTNLTRPNRRACTLTTTRLSRLTVMSGSFWASWLD